MPRGEVTGTDEPYGHSLGNRALPPPATAALALGALAGPAAPSAGVAG
ncbi:MAG TPA: hypothetical protein VE987_18000 [Polyangiaceae bacterium]|nr:hypothetical protein [Polyangiaceae bacterium]